MCVSAVILAAGQGTRMRSTLPKVLHSVAGKPMVMHAVEVAGEASEATPVLVVGVGADEVRMTVGERARYAVQEQQLGTGHAVLQAKPVLASERTDNLVGAVLVTYADMPLLRTETLRRLIKHHQRTMPVITMLTVIEDDPRGFGRVVRDASNGVRAVVEEVDATDEQLAIRELNAGVYCFDADWLWGRLEEIPLNSKGEYYLTDLVGMAVVEGYRVEALTTDTPSEVLGINSRVHLAEAEAAFRRRINQQWMVDGVTIVDPDHTYIEADVRLGSDTVIYPNTYLQGKTSIGDGCRIGPNSIIRDSTLGDRCVVSVSVIDMSRLEDEVEIGPFARLRRGSDLGTGVHMGNFGEVKNSRLGPGTKMGHFSYVGDATIGADVNIGAGTITCNYDGLHKHHTEIEEGAFIGSDTMLVAPVRVGKGASTGAGSVVTRDVPPGSLAFGAPARVRSVDREEKE